MPIIMPALPNGPSLGRLSRASYFYPDQNVRRSVSSRSLVHSKPGQPCHRSDCSWMAGNPEVIYLDVSRPTQVWQTEVFVRSGGSTEFIHVDLQSSTLICRQRR